MIIGLYGVPYADDHHVDDHDDLYFWQQHSLCSNIILCREENTVVSALFSFRNLNYKHEQEIDFRESQLKSDMIVPAERECMKSIGRVDLNIIEIGMI